MDSSSWPNLLIREFPNLASEEFEIIAPDSDQYNCIAYVAGDTGRWWWPDVDSYWPAWATSTNSIESLKEAFAGLGYEQCDDSAAEAGYQKIALYEALGVMTHIALQMPNGRWRSKLGRGPVIEHHSPESLSGENYGNPTIFMRRAL